MSLRRAQLPQMDELRRGNMVFLSENYLSLFI